MQRGKKIVGMTKGKMYRAKDFRIVRVSIYCLCIPCFGIFLLLLLLVRLCRALEQPALSISIKQKHRMMEFYYCIHRAHYQHAMRNEFGFGSDSHKLVGSQCNCINAFDHIIRFMASLSLCLSLCRSGARCK